MNAEHEKALVEAAPILYRQTKLSEMESCMAFGFACEDGWFDLLLKLSRDLEFLNKVVGIPNKLRIEALQVKEKFGSLRFYLDIVDEDPASEDKVHCDARENIRSIAHKLAHEAENNSADICELCGHCGEITDIHGWYRTLCKKCKEAQNESNTWKQEEHLQ